jgi:hypothetical protein
MPKKRAPKMTVKARSFKDIKNCVRTDFKAAVPGIKPKDKNPDTRVQDRLQSVFDSGAIPKNTDTRTVRDAFMEREDIAALSPEDRERRWSGHERKLADFLEVLTTRTTLIGRKEDITAMIDYGQYLKKKTKNTLS